jgi:DNA-binding transcriptional LysR family regulator
MINISRIDLNLFVVFNAIYTGGGITRASETLKLTQPAVSHALGRLRAIVDDPLFLRKGHGMVPTPIAHELIGPIRRAISEIEGSLGQLSAFDPLTSQREFRIGMRPIVESAAIPELMMRIQHRAPGVSITSSRHQRADFQSELANGALAAVIDVLVPLAHNIRTRRLAGGKMIVVARRDHPQVQGSISLEDYLTQGHILASSRKTGPGLEDVELSRLGLQREVKLRCQQYTTACDTVSMTDLLLTMPEHFAHLTNQALNNQLLPFPIDVVAQDIFLYWHANAEHDRANQWLRENIAATFQTSNDASPASAQ